MTPNDDLPLFAWRPSSNVLPFPQSRRAGRARHVAERMAAKSGPDADRYWRITIATLMRQLASAGLDRDTVMREADGFRRAVERELVHYQRSAGRS